MSLPSIPDTTELTPQLTRVLAQNPSSFTLQGTNLYLFHGTSATGSLLIDSGSGKPEVPTLLRQALQKNGISSLQHLILTHHHPDHIGGVQSLSDLTAGATISKYPDSHSEPSWKPLTDEQRIPLSKEEDTDYLQVMHTPGHTADSICLLWYQSAKLVGIFTADTVLGHGTSVFEDLGAYMSSLLAMQDLLEAAQPNVIPLYPGHGLVRENGLATVREYRQHRLDREREVLEALEGGPATVNELLRRIYPDIPPDVVPAATRGLQLQLDKLVVEGRVRLQEDGKYSLNQGKL